MTILSKIKYLFNKPEIANFPKYLALAGLIYSAVLPTQAIALDGTIFKSEKPALLALSDIKLFAPVRIETKNGSCQLMLSQGSALISQANPIINPENLCPSSAKVVNRKKVTVTAYSSTQDQTDSTPFVTALGTTVRDGIVASNFLGFGTKIRLPEIYGEKIFVVEDRMASWNNHKLDIWMPSKNQAKEFGVKRLTLEILQ